jgi:NADH dehydrogenase FAD-containing subunit
MGDPSGPEPERIIKRDLWEYASRRRMDGPYADNLDIDVMIVGAGFAGVFLLYEMRKAGEYGLHLCNERVGCLPSNRIQDCSL